MNKTALWIVAAVLILVVGGVLIAQNANAPETINTQTETPDTNTGTDTGTTANETAIKTFTVTADNFKFDMSEIRVQEGDTVRITLINTQGVHDWRIDAFDAGTKVLQANQQETIEFIADTKGTFEYYCSVGSHRAMGMKGNLIVE